MVQDTIDFNAVLNLADDSVEVTSVDSFPDQQIVHVRKKSNICFCPDCGSRCRSKGIRYREINHPIFQDGRSLTLSVETRKWNCPSCNKSFYDSFKFVEKYKQTSIITVLIILDKMKDLNRTAVSIAFELNVSDTFVHQTFMKYVSLPRLPLPETLCIDEVYMKIDKKNLYQAVLIDWATGEPVDILRNRFKSTLDKYFSSIPREERLRVKYLISDMYDTFTDLTTTWLPNAVSVIDTFHHTSPIINYLNQYIHTVQKRYQKRDAEKLKEENYRNNRDNKTRKDSREVYLLKHYRFFILKNKDDIDYTPKFRQGKHGGYWSYPYELEKEFMALDENFSKLRDLKEMYIHFTRDHMNDPEGAKEELESLIKLYKASEFGMFRYFACTLENHKTGIIASFTFLSASRSKRDESSLCRLSNGIMEAYNNCPKDYKRIANGVSNFDYTRNRILWATRANPSMLAVPRSIDEIHVNGKSRGGSYRKKPKEEKENVE